MLVLGQWVELCNLTCLDFKYCLVYILFSLSHLRLPLNALRLLLVGEQSAPRWIWSEDFVLPRMPVFDCMLVCVYISVILSYGEYMEDISTLT